MPNTGPLGLPSTFLWGASTAAYQIEGGVRDGGRAPSSWDAFAHQPGRVLGGDTGDVACDSYHRWSEDVALLKELGVDAYRFSFSWSRVQPSGRGQVNRDGLAYYDRLVDALLEAGIAPSPTLFHWDTPLALEEDGGWRNRDIAGRFADYAHLMGEHFGDRIARWITINEPAVLTMLGYGVGIHAPGERLGLGALTVAHHQLLAHGRAVNALRAAGVGEIGIANNHTPIWPASDREEDLTAAGLYDDLANRLFADPILLGRFPAALEALLPERATEDLSEISAPIDWYGVNYYNPTLVATPSAGRPIAVIDGQEIDTGLPFALPPIKGYRLTGFGWPIVPAGLTELLTTMAKRYGDALPPLYITENGCAFSDAPGEDGAVHDTRRIGFTESHLLALVDAIDAGVDVRGYFHWSLLDNFEWAVGYSQRFGLVHVNFDTLERTPKDSFYWLRNLIRNGR